MASLAFDIKDIIAEDLCPFGISLRNKPSLRRTLRRLGELLEDAVALELGKVVDEQDAVEMVDLVLQAGGEEPIGLDLLRRTLEIEVFYLHLRRAFHVAVIFRDREAALLVGRLLRRRPHDLRIDEDLRALGLLFLGQVQGDDALGRADLDGGEPDPGRVVHGLEHVLDQLADAGVDLLHRLGDLPQPLVRQNENVAQRHGRDVSGRRKSVNPAAFFPRRQGAAPEGIDLSFTFCSYPANRCRVVRMIDSLLPLAGAAVIVLAGLAALAAVAVAAIRTLRQRDREAADAQMAELARLQAETAVRIEGMRDMLAGRQAELHRAVNERLDSVSHHLNQSMTTTREHTVESLQRLNERLAVIDNAQKNITDLSSRVSSLSAVLSNKQARGAFGQARMEAIVQDGLPKGCYQFQLTLSNRSRPDCVIFLPDQRPLVIDAKFPLEAVTAFREGKSEDERKLAASRLRQDISRHVADIADKYLIPGET